MSINTSDAWLWQSLLMIVGLWMWYWVADMYIMFLLCWYRQEVFRRWGRKAVCMTQRRKTPPFHGTNMSVCVLTDWIFSIYEYLWIMSWIIVFSALREGQVMTHKESPPAKNAFLQQLDSLDVSVTVIMWLLRIWRHLFSESDSSEDCLSMFCVSRREVY